MQVVITFQHVQDPDDKGEVGGRECAAGADVGDSWSGGAGLLRHFQHEDTLQEQVAVRDCPEAGNQPDGADGLLRAGPGCRIDIGRQRYGREYPKKEENRMEVGRVICLRAKYFNNTH